LDSNYIAGRGKLSALRKDQPRFLTMRTVMTAVMQ